jgi:hypothetical protein
MSQSESQATQSEMINHAVAALVISFGLSIGFWAILGVFNLGGFIIWSLVAAVVGGALGYRLTKQIMGTVIITALIRIAIYVIMTSVVP